MPRGYNKKKTEYWTQKAQARSALAAPAQLAAQMQPLGPKFSPELNPSFAGEEGYGRPIAPFVSDASWAPQTDARRLLWSDGLGLMSPEIRFPNVYAGILPYQNVHSCIALSDAIQLAQKAWANIAIVRNTIEAMVEFSCSKIHLKCKNKTAKRMCEAWLKRVRIDDFQERFFRELYRSGNVFAYRIIGNLNKDLLKELKTTFGYELKKNTIIVGYVILNPVNVAVKNGGVGLYQSYIKFLTSLELNSLKNDDFGLEMLKQMGIDDKTLKNAPYPHVFLEFDSNRIIPVFYQKQDYEPLAVPPLWSLMDDLELKLKMKRADEAVIMTVENILLHLSHGDEPLKGGINPNVGAALTEMFSNQKTSRVLVTDYTVKAEFVIPDLKNVLGDEKYKQVNRDIEEGLQSLIMGDEKFSNAMTKAKLFLERLNSGRAKFIRFLENEIEDFCNVMNYRDIPTIEMEEASLDDETQRNRIYTQLAQFGLLTPGETFDAIRQGLLPSQDESEVNQAQYVKDRNKGFYTPLAPTTPNGNVPIATNMKKPVGKPGGATGPISKPKKVPIIGNEESENELYPISIAAIIEVTRAMELLKTKIQADYKEVYPNGNLDDNFAYDMVNNIIANSEKDNWNSIATEVVVSQKEANNEEIQAKIKEVGDMYDLTSYAASIVYHGLKEKN